MSAYTSNMDSGEGHKEGNGSFPIKRKPEEEVQFVSSKPVKKCRGSKDSSAEAHRAVGTANTSRVDPPPGDTRPGNTRSHLEPSLPTSQPLHESSNFNRGVSLPSMENYVFPPPHDGITSQTCRSSPMLSPKQLPQTTPSGQGDAQMTPSTISDANDAKPPAWFNTSWAASGVPSQPTPTTFHMAANQPMVSPYVQPPGVESSAAVHDVKQQSRTSEKFTDPAQCPQPASQPRKELHMEHTQNNHQYHSQENDRSIQATQPFRTQKEWQPAQPAPRTPPGPMPGAQLPGQQHAGNSNGYASATVHPLSAKPPCFACEQMRQQALHNKTNIYPLVGTASHVHHGWHGPDVAHLTHPAHMQSAPFPNAGFGVSPDVPQNRMHRPQHLYHGQVPMGYGLTHVPAQGPYPASLQRAFPVPDMSTSESAPGIPSHKFNHNPQLNLSSGATPMSQTERAQYTQDQPASSQPLQAQPSSKPAPSSTPATPPAPRPPTPSPPDNHSPNLIVDIAETCEALFPWDEVAERHNVPRQKVADTFAAIIQLPLIRCTTDKKRHGRLATNRLKDYTRGKNAMYISSPGSPATQPAAAKPDSNDNQDNRPVLPGVVELANSMAPVAFPSNLAKKYPGTW